MNRAVEIINSLRIALEHMTKEANVQKVSSLRLFNFEKNRVSLRMELVRQDNEVLPMGMIDVVEFPTGDKKRGSCSCQITELTTGRTEKLVLHPNHEDQKKIETEKIFNFFKKVVQFTEGKDADIKVQSVKAEYSVDVELTKDPALGFSPKDGKIPNRTRGAQ